jgi:hypothetical protein
LKERKMLNIFLIFFYVKEEIKKQSDKKNYSIYKKKFNYKNEGKKIQRNNKNKFFSLNY